MKLQKGKWFIIGFAGMICLLLAYGCMDQRAAVLQSTKAPQPVVSPKLASHYDIIVKGLSTAECARCHISEFNRLKYNGAKHQSQGCTDCHTEFHVYSPLKNNYAEIMPKCSTCHKESPHGKDQVVQKCLSCHKDPHGPLVSIPDPADLEQQCRICHAKVAESMIKYPSTHTEEECSSCHSQKHGRIPECSECHDNHSPMAPMGTKECFSCHPVHTPLNIIYSGQVSNNVVCAGCHNVPFEQLKTNQTKHSALACAQCHPKHKQLMTCQQCHGKSPHYAAIHAKFPKCGSCHGTAHDLKK